MYSFRLKSGDITLMFNRRNARRQIPNCRLEIGSLSCWSPGFYAIYERVKTFLAAYGAKVIKERVSEVHLAADFIGTDIKATLDHRTNWIALPGMKEIMTASRSASCRSRTGARGPGF